MRHRNLLKNIIHQILNNFIRVSRMYKSVMQYFSAFSLLMFTSVSFSQGSYQVELSASYLKEETNTIDDKFEANLLTAEIFFDKVETASHPFAEAAYLEHTSSLLVRYVDSELATPSYDIDYASAGLEANYVVPDSLYILKALYSSLEADYKGGVNGSIDGDALGFGAGIYLTDNSSIVLSYLQLDYDFEIISFLASSNKATDIDIEYKRIQALEDGRAYGFIASLMSSEFETATTSEINTIIDVAFDYYFNRSISVGAEIEINSGDDKAEEGNAVGINASMYLTPVFSVYASLNQFSADNVDGDDNDKVLLGASARF